MIMTSLFIDTLTVDSGKYQWSPTAISVNIWFMDVKVQIRCHRQRGHFLSESPLGTRVTISQHGVMQKCSIIEDIFLCKLICVA